MKYEFNLLIMVTVLFLVSCNHYIEYDSDVTMVYYSDESKTCMIISEKKPQVNDTSWTSYHCEILRDSVSIFFLNIGDSISVIQKNNIKPDETLMVVEKDKKYKVLRFKPFYKDDLNRKCIYYFYYSFGQRILLWPYYLDLYIEKGLVKKIKYLEPHT